MVGGVCGAYKASTSGQCMNKKYVRLYFFQRQVCKDFYGTVKIFRTLSLKRKLFGSIGVL